MAPTSRSPIRAVRAQVVAWMSGSARSDLEAFWPSRRGHAYDELCQPAASR